jgi:HemY protein
MRFVIFALAAALIAILATGLAIENPGYVLIARAPWSVEMPLTLFLPLMLVAFALLLALLYLVVRLLRIPRDVTRWRARRAQREGRATLIRGLTNLAEGNWSEAEAALLTAQRHSDAPLLAYLGAACAAQGQGQTEKRDEYLAAAHRQSPRAGLAIGTIQAYLQHLAHQQEQTLATLSELHRQQPRHKHTLKLLTHEYTTLRDWTGLIELMPELRRQMVLPASEIDSLELKAHRELLTQTLPSGSLDVLNRAWNAVPKTLRRQAAMIAIYARHLIQQNEMVAAEQVLRAALESAWDDGLINLYGQLKLDAAHEALDNAENWLAGHPDNARLLLALGRLAARANETAKARTYLERSVALRPASDAYQELGMLLERQGDSAAALAAYRRGLESGIEESRGGARLYRFSPHRSQAAG